MRAGKLDRRVTFRKRVDQERAGGNEKGDFDDYWSTWANYREFSAREIANMGQAEDVPFAVLTVRDCTAARLITNSDRVRIRGVAQGDFAIQNVSLPERTGWLRIKIARTMAG
jgi:head-tail adaptor